MREFTASGSGPTNLLKQGEIAAFGRSADIIQDELLHTIYGNNISLDYGEKGATIVFEMNPDKE